MNFFSLIRRLAWRFREQALPKKTGRKSRPGRSRLQLEALEGRVVPANISIDPNIGMGRVQLVDVNRDPILAPVYGQRVNLLVEYTTVDVFTPYTISVSIDDETLFLSGQGGAGTQRHTAFVNGWYASDGVHPVEVRVDINDSVSETNEQDSDNFTTFDYSPIEPTGYPLLNLPVTGTRDVDWIIARYTDISPVSVRDPFGAGITVNGHEGIDFAIPSYRVQDIGNVAAVAAADGTVIEVQDGNFDRRLSVNGSAGLGNYVLIDHGNGWQTRYRSLREDTIFVTVGQQVVGGQYLGLVGGSGAVDHPGLRFELLYLNNFATNPTGEADPVETFLVPPTSPLRTPVPFSYWADPPEYQGTRPVQVFYFDIGSTNPTAHLTEEPEGTAKFPTLLVGGSASQRTVNTATIYFNARVSHLPGGATVIWRRPDGSIALSTGVGDSPYGGIVSALPAQTSPSTNQAWNVDPDKPITGTWSVQLVYNSQVLASHNFEVTANAPDANGNQTVGAGDPDIMVTTTDEAGQTALIVNGRDTTFDLGTFTGGGSASKTFTITNEGYDTLSYTVTAPPGFTASGGGSVAKQSSGTFTVSLDGSRTGFQLGYVRIQSNDVGDGENDIFFRVQGTVVPPHAPATPTINTTVGAPGATNFEQSSVLVKNTPLNILDTDSAFFIGGQAIVTILDDGDPSDILGIRHQGFGPGQVGVDGIKVYFGGKWVGNYSYNAGNLTLTVNFNPDSTATAAAAILSQITFDTTGTAGGQRVIQMRVVDDTGRVSNRVSSYLIVADYVSIQTLPFSDDFEEVDRALSVAWTTQVGGFRSLEEADDNDNPVRFAQANDTALNLATVKLATPAADVDVSATISVPANDDSAGLVARYSGPGDRNMYWGGLVNRSGVVSAEIWRNLGGNWVRLATSTVGTTTTGTLRFEVVDRVLRLSLDDTLVTSFVDTISLAPGLVGMRSSAGLRIDDFDAKVLTQPTSASDNLDGPDGTVIAPQWTEPVGDFARANDQFVGIAALNVAAFTGLWLVDASVQADVAVLNNDDSAGLVARYQGTGDRNMYWGGLVNNLGVVSAEIWRNLNGNWLRLVTSVVGTTTGTLRFEVVGSSLKLFLNNNTVAHAYDGAISGPGVTGLRGAQGETFDDFQVSDLSPTRQSLPFTDNFNLIPGSGLSRNWTERVGTYEINASQQASSLDPLSIATLNVPGEADVQVQAQVNLPVNGNSLGLVARYQGPGDTNMYWGGLVGNAGGASADIWRNLNGNWVRLGTTAVMGATGTLTFRLQGNQLLLTYGNTQLRVLDAGLTGPGLIGMRSSNNTSLDNFSAAAVTPSVPFRDDFNRQSSDGIGSAWVEENGDLEIVPDVTNASNVLRVKGNGPTGVATYKHASLADVSVSADIELPTTGFGSAAVIARYSGLGDSNMYQGAAVARNGVFTGEIWRNVNGNWTLLASAPLPSVPTPTNRGTLNLEVQGNRLILLLDTIVVTRTIDNALQGPGLVGVRGSGGITFENFVFDRVVPIPPFSDNFNRANNTNLNPNPAAPIWREEIGNLEINANQLLGLGPVNVATYTGISYPDGIVEMSVNVSGNLSAGAVARYTGPGDSNMYWGGFVARNGVVSAEIWRNLGGNWTRLTTSVLASGTGTLRFEVTGSSLRLFRNGIVVGAAVDSTIRAPGLFGARMSAGASVDDFIVTPI